MVFSNTHNILKVIEIDRLKAEKNQQVEKVSREACVHRTAPVSPLPGPSFTEDFLKTEPVFDGTMFHESDCEFFQDLGLWCSPDKEYQIQTTDAMKNTEEKALNTATPDTRFSPQGWDGFDANSPLAQSGFYTSTPQEPLSPKMDTTKFVYPDLAIDGSQEQFLDISSLPVVIGGLASEDLIHSDQFLPAKEQQSWTNPHDKNYTEYTNTLTNMPFIDQEDSLGYDTKCITWSDDVLKNQERSNDVVISEYIINEDTTMVPAVTTPFVAANPNNLKLDVSAHAPIYDPIINTPDVLCFVEQLENENFDPLQDIDKKLAEDLQENITVVSADSFQNSLSASTIDFNPVTPKSESYVESDGEDTKSMSPLKKRRRDSEYSDETYTPYSEKITPRKYKRRKPNVPIKDMIVMLEGNQQQTKARRGRPPKRRDSVVSSVCSIDESISSTSNHEYKYRELRDKNNEASKRSRMNRKLKELQMEQLAIELEEKNKKLTVRVGILEDMTKRLKEALMVAILHK